ncbi:MAG TPA: 16S rRNA (cytidine(1402)-2'-O)-methyltransferase [Terriglobia bacterium]|nr:16S rRNA (cytidine(1402)-2'-O)-methyltransferase [Terriglobia bacterium]
MAPRTIAEGSKPAGPGGALFVVATPIGNLEDITLRAIRTLKEADLIACEDTRHTQGLLEHYAIRTNLISYHEHNEMTRAPELILLMEQGSKIALVSDAGMPVVSDPGCRLVRLAIRHGIPVIPVPGPSAFVASLAASGLPLERFQFLGFLPSKKLARQKALRGLTETAGTLVFYESPHRVIEMLEDVLKILGDRPAVFAREVTKIHEEFLSGSVSEILSKLSTKTVKGEITVLIGPADPAVRKAASASALKSILREVERLMRQQDVSERDALKALARSSGISRSELYRRLQSERSPKAAG